MLPILKRLKEAPATGVMIKERQPDSDESNEQDDSTGKEACGQAMLKAIQENNPKALAEAALDLFAIGDSEEHVEGPHTSKHDYDAQNQKAGKEQE